MVTCPVCGDEGGRFEDFEGLAGHFVALAEVSDGRHIMWLNRNVTKHAVGAEELARLLSGHDESADRVRR